MLVRVYEIKPGQAIANGLRKIAQAIAEAGKPEQPVQTTKPQRINLNGIEISETTKRDFAQKTAKKYRRYLTAPMDQRDKAWREYREWQAICNEIGAGRLALDLGEQEEVKSRVPERLNEYTVTLRNGGTDRIFGKSFTDALRRSEYGQVSADLIQTIRAVQHV